MSLVELNVDGAAGIASIVINRPEVLNALDLPTARAIRDAVLSLVGDARVRCVLLKGAGRGFMAGGDVTRFAEDFDRADKLVDELLDCLHPAIEALRQIDAPVVAAVHGAVAGGGLSLMCGCDLVLAADNARFVIAYDRIGNSPDCGGSYYLPRLLGIRRAAQFFMLSETLDATAALNAGLVNRVVPADRLAEEAEALAQKLAAGPTRAYGQYKRLVARAFDRELPDQLEAEREAFKAGTKTADFREGVSAFLAKRPPDFKGR